MLHLRQISDVHLEFHFDELDNIHSAAELVNAVLPPLPTDKKSVLIIAGDLAPISRARRIINFLRLVQPRFRHVIYVLGNHEHYNGVLADNEDRLLDALSDSGELEMDAITVAGNRTRVVTIKGVRFICATLWTDYLGDNLEAKAHASRYLNDHRLIVPSTDELRPVTPDDLHQIFTKTRSDLEAALGRSADSGHTVVVTHHLPSFQAVNPAYTLTDRDRLLNGAFASNLDELILKYQPAYWFFGHTHTPYRGKIGETTLVCNPVGYPQEDNVRRGRYVNNEVFVV